MSSQKLYGAKMAVISELYALASEASQPGWDEDEGAPLNRAAVHRATQFLLAMPDELPLPEVSPIPDGTISLDWRPSQYRMFVVNIMASDRLPFAWFIGSDAARGVARFRGDVIPAAILNGLTAVHEDVY